MAVNYVHTLTKTPLARYDGVPWTQARIEQAATEAGSFTAVETLDLSPVDADPSNPQVRSLTTDQATLASGWFRVVFIDATSDESPPSDPVLSPPPPPPAAASLASLDDLKGYLDISKTTQDSFLQNLLDSVSLQVERYTAKRFSPTPAFVGDPPADIATPAAVTVGLGGCWARIPHAREIGSVTVDGTTVTASTDLYVTPGYQLQTDPTLRDPFYRYIVFSSPAAVGSAVTVTGRFGIVPVPADIRDAVLMMAARRYRERDASYGDQVLLADGAMVNYFKQMPPSVRGIVDSYCELGV